MMDSLLDWITPTKGLRRLNAPEETDDYRPAHTPLTSVDELKKIFGWAVYTSHDGWDKDFTTIIGGCQQIDAAYASRDVLRAFGIPDDFVDRFLQARRGPDALDGTADDPQMDQSMAFSLLGIQGGAAAPAPVPVPGGTGTTPQVNGVQSLIVFKSPNPVFRIVSVGKSGDVTRSIQMVVQKQLTPVGVAVGAGVAVAAGRPQVFSWKEL